jgi:uracil-DNA glycosylase
MNEMDLYKTYQNLKERYLVPDVNWATCRILFILESPHVSEVKNGYPAAGSSGIEMSKQLFAREEDEKALPLGKILFDGQCNSLGIMNFCSIPMQLMPYSKQEQEQMADFLSLFSTLRSSPAGKKRQNPNTEKLESILLTDFRERLTRYLSLGNVEIVIPCGRVAQAYLEASAVIPPRVINVPHPSYQNWSRKQSKKSVSASIEEMKNAVKMTVANSL